MNERIRELEKQATVRGEEYLPGNDGHSTPTFYFDKEKFAELIVRECVTICNDTNGASYLNGVYAGRRIKEHFGVQE